MSEYIEGHKLLDRLGIRGFELFNYVSAGKLKPFDKLGRLYPHPYLLSDPEFEKLKGELKFHESTLKIAESYTIPQDHPQRKSLEDSIRAKKESSTEAIAWLKSQLYDFEAGSAESQGWEDSQLPDNEKQAQKLINVILESLYREKDVLKLESELGFNTLRQNQKDKIKCREMAKSLWEKHPSITIADMAKRKEIIQAGGQSYTPRTVQKWIKDLCPNRNPGRRPKKA